jgi:hypothetical protein
VRVQIRYDYDPNVYGYHVDAIRNGERRAYVRGRPSEGTPDGPGTTGLDWYRRALSFMNNRYETQSPVTSANEIARKLLNGEI